VRERAQEGGGYTLSHFQEIRARKKKDVRADARAAREDREGIYVRGGG